MSRRVCCLGVGAAVALGVAAYLGLHFLEPPLAITWSYAHLGRRAALPWIAAALVGLLPAGTALAWSRPWAQRALGHLRWRTLLVGGALLGAILLPLGLSFPAPPFSVDVVFFAYAVKTGTGENARWDLLLRTFKHLSSWVRPPWDALSVIHVANGVLATVAFVALVLSVRRLTRTRGEAAAATALCSTAFGTLQLAMGYSDIYPFPLAVTAVYCATALGALAGDVHPAWPLAIAALAPFWYVALVLLLPSVLIVVFESLRRPRGLASMAVAGAVALGLAGLATVPGFGQPFAWRAFLAAAVRDSKYELGLDPNSSLLPRDFMLSGTHAREVLHTLLLVDGIGWILLLGPGAWLALRCARDGWDARAGFLALLVLPGLAYLIAMDPLFGSYADWDLFSYGAVASSLLGAYAFVLWGRECPRAFSALLGLCLAGAAVHLLARLNALDVDLARHLAESPYHIATQ